MPFGRTSICLMVSMGDLVMCNNVPLACAEEDAELADTLIRGSIRNSLPRNANGFPVTSPLNSARLQTNPPVDTTSLQSIIDSNGNENPASPSLIPHHQSHSSRGSPSSGDMDNLGEDTNFSGSLEDLVSNFDDKITNCLKDFGEGTQQLAPVQIRTQEEIMSESHGSLSEEDEELARALDLHSLILQPTPHPDSPPQTAEQVIEEIDEIMGGSSTASELTGSSDYTMDSATDSFSSPKSPIPFFAAFARDLQLEAKVREAAAMTSSEQKLNRLAYKKLIALQTEMESLIQAYNETLVAELALKDELEYEKELKNSFISLLVSIQNKRRQIAAERKKNKNKDVNRQPQYLTAVIPYEEGRGPPGNEHLHALIKILRAVNDDNPNTTNMLTDYILNVLCPSSEVEFALPSNPMA